MKRRFRRLIVGYILLLISFRLFADNTINSTLNTGPDPDLSIKNMSGSLIVTAWDKQQIKVEGTFGSNVERILIEEKGNNIVVRPEIKSKYMKKGKNIHCNLTIYAPAKSSLSIDMLSADLKLTGFERAVNVDSVSGDININARARSMDVQTISGDIEIVGSARRFEGISISGDISLDGNFPSIKVKTTSGELNYKGSLLEHASIYSTSGEISVYCTELDGSHIEIGTVSAEVQLVIPRTSSVELRLKSVSGSMTANSSLYEKVSSEDRTLMLKRGDGDSSIYIDTISGKISISG